jgi:Family of unknown function (DUF6600)
MTRKLIIALGLVAIALPALGQEQTYDYGDEYNSGWNEEAPPDAYQEVPDASVTFDTFRDGLAQYGDWVDVPTYGQVWRPAHVTAGWRPYLYGRWEWTDGGWLWVSEEPWGWAAYHYGRWAADPNYGWIWVPDYQWAPAWVTWRYSADYVGWAPLAPGVSVYTTTYPVDYRSWSFVPCNRFVSAPVYSVAYSTTYARGIFQATVPAPPRATTFGMPAPVWGGPARPFVERAIGRRIAPVRVQSVASPSALRGPARPGVVPVYGPEVRSAPAVGRPAIAAPARPWGGAQGRTGVFPAPSRSALPPGQGSIRQAPPPRGNEGWQVAPPAQAPAPAWRTEGQRSRPLQYAPPSRSAPRQQFQGGGLQGGVQAQARGEGAVRQTPRMGGWRSATSAQAPALAWRSNGQSSRPQERIVALSVPSGRSAPAPRQQFQGSAQAQTGGGFRNGAQAQHGGAYFAAPARGGARR